MTGGPYIYIKAKSQIKIWSKKWRWRRKFICLKVWFSGIVLDSFIQK
jgi:hypothetical protein